MKELRNVKLDDLELSVRARALVDRLDLDTVGDVLAREQDVATRMVFGVSRWAEICEVIVGKAAEMMSEDE
ncbi:hypothetical protein HN371_08645 [Candidatus Poribacteria bacterium]|jgi:hypothetical protein|nr:hypothetical protein [Candidatus Poribacteria bacterium]MBT7098054.1 hypothetical protein [Candidatus Poribacteria bacterium]